MRIPSMFRCEGASGPLAAARVGPNLNTCRNTALAPYTVLSYLQTGDPEEPGGGVFLVMFWSLSTSQKLFCPKPEKSASCSISLNVYGGYLSPTRIVLWVWFWFSWEKSFHFLGTFHLKAQFLMRKVCFCMSLSMLGGGEDSRRKALTRTCVGQCVLMNIDFRNIRYLG